MRDKITLNTMKFISLSRRAATLRGLSLLLAVFFFISNVTLLHAAETNFWKERQKAASLANSLQLAQLPAPIFPSNMIPGSPRPMIVSPALSRIPQSDVLRNLPYNIGTIRKVNLPTVKLSQTNTLVLHIQDVHMNVEAQSNIAQTVKTLLESGKVGLVALEGTSGLIDLSSFKNFPYPQSVKTAADYELKENGISGPIHAA